MTLILASKSPRRQALLAALGLTFTVGAADVDETPLPGEAPDALACRLCRAKAQAVAARHPGKVILAADTMVAIDGLLLGKPADEAEATAMLRALHALKAAPPSDPVVTQWATDVRRLYYEAHTWLTAHPAPTLAARRTEYADLFTRAVAWASRTP